MSTGSKKYASLQIFSHTPGQGLIFHIHLDTNQTFWHRYLSIDIQLIMFYIPQSHWFLAISTNQYYLNDGYENKKILFIWVNKHFVQNFKFLCQYRMPLLPFQPIVPCASASKDTPLNAYIRTHEPHRNINMFKQHVQSYFNKYDYANYDEC